MISKRIFSNCFIIHAYGLLLILSNMHAMQATTTTLPPPIPGFEWEAHQWDTPKAFCNETVVVSLGGNCAPARHFQYHQLSEAYMPFDWVFSDFESVYLAIYHDFKGFLENIAVKSSGEEKHEVVDQTYNIRFVHEFKNFDGITNANNNAVTLYDYHENKEKYTRRIKRLQSVFTSNKKVFLFRTIITKQDAILLRNLISAKYPKLNYTLVVINNTEDFKTPWLQEHIRNFYLYDPTSASVTQEMVDAWNPIFKALELIK